MINNVVLDKGLFYLVQKTTRLVLTENQATTYEEATDDAVRIGEKLLPVVVGPSNATPSGRLVTVSEITDGQILMDGTIAFWALVDDNAQICTASGQLIMPKTVSAANSFILEAFNITLPG